MQGSATTLANATGFTQAQPFTYSVAAERNASGSGSGQEIFGATGAAMYWGGSNNQATLYAGSTCANSSISDHSFHALLGVFNGNGSASRLYADGTAVNCNAGTTGQSGAINLDSNQPQYLFEVGEWAGALSGTQASNLSSNQHSYWGF
jgi:hypothetical protein